MHRTTAKSVAPSDRLCCFLLLVVEMIQLYQYSVPVQILHLIHWTKKDPQWQEEGVHKASPTWFLLIKWISSVVTG